MTESVPPSLPRRPRSIFRRIILWGVVPLFVVFFAGLASLYALCLYKPEVIVVAVQRGLSEATGMPWRINGGIQPVFVPYPGLVLSDVSLMAATKRQSQYADVARPLAHVAKLRLYADPASLSRMTLRLLQIEFVDPVINLTYDRYDRPLWRPLPVPVPKSSPGSRESAAADRFVGCNVEALQRVADILNALPPQVTHPVIIRNGSINSYAADGSLLLSFIGIDGAFDPDASEDNLRLSIAFLPPDAGLALNVSLVGRIGGEGMLAKGRLSGWVDLTPPGSRMLSGAFESSFAWQEGGRHLRLPNFRLTAEGDALSGDLTIDLADPECVGTVLVHRLSLPRWFSFARWLPRGLAEALHTVKGEFDLHLDRNRAEARNLRGTAGVFPISGYVGTPDFSAPVVVADLDLDEVDLDLLFPFLAVAGAVVPEPEAPVFDHPPLAPYPGEPRVPAESGAPSGTKVSYDVTVRSPRPKVHTVDGGPLTVRVFPAVVADASKVRVTFSTQSFLAGALYGRLDINRHAILMHYDVKDMELGLLPENVDRAVTVAGQITGICEIDAPLLPDGSLADDWKLRIHAAIKDCEIVGHNAGAQRRLFGGTVTAVGQGDIYAARGKGMRITGLWDIAAAGIRTSWSSRGNDAIKGTFAGGVHRPSMVKVPDAAVPGGFSVEKRGVDKVAGKLNLTGSLIVPMGSWLRPVTGKLQADLDWRLDENTIALQNVAYEGFGSYVEGSAAIDLSGREVLFDAEVNGKINLWELLKGWDALPPAGGAGVQPPQLLIGRTVISGGSAGSLRFDPIRAELDGAPVSGEIFRTAGGSENKEAGVWTVRLFADHLNLDNYFPPAPQQRPLSHTPWDLSFLKGLGLDAQITLGSVKKDRLTSGRSKATVVLQRDRFSLSAESAAFYDGAATLVLQGAVVPDSSQVILRRGLIQVENVDLGRILYDFSQDTSFGGTASLLVEVTGTIRSGTDIPAALSGIWNLRIADGLYPAFLGGESSTLRNTFSSASASGVLEKGVLRSRNFTLTGLMVDMIGGGWFDLASKEYDVEVSVTFAKVPTVPMRFHGSIHEPQMRVRGVDMVVETVQHAGGTIFSLLRGVLMLPAHALIGVTELFGGTEERQQPVRTAPLAPVRQETGNPGQ